MLSEHPKKGCCDEVVVIQLIFFPFEGSIVEEEEEEGEEGAEQSTDDKIKLEQAKLEQDKKALQDNHSMMAEVCTYQALFSSFFCI